jgi:hypothetical protein
MWTFFELSIYITINYVLLIIIKTETNNYKVHSILDTLSTSHLNYTYTLIYVHIIFIEYVFINIKIAF